jgi:hypothetical protein
MTEKKQNVKDVPLKPSDATTPTEALVDVMKGVDLGNKKGDSSGVLPSVWDKPLKESK